MQMMLLLVPYTFIGFMMGSILLCRYWWRCWSWAPCWRLCHLLYCRWAKPCNKHILNTCWRTIQFSCTSGRLGEHMSRKFTPFVVCVFQVRKQPATCSPLQLYSCILIQTFLKGECYLLPVVVVFSDFSLCPGYSQRLTRWLETRKVLVLKIWRNCSILNRCVYQLQTQPVYVVCCLSINSLQIATYSTVQYPFCYCRSTVLAVIIGTGKSNCITVVP